MYIFYVDESGRPNLDDKSMADDPWFVMTAVGVHCDNWIAIDTEISRLKNCYFPNIKPIKIELKSSNIRSAGGKHPVFPFGTIPLTKLSQLVEEIYAIYDRFDLPIISVVINKRHHKDKYTSIGKRPEFPYQLAFKILVERIDWFLQNKNDNKQDRNKEFAFAILDEYIGQYKVTRTNLLWYQEKGTFAKDRIDNIKEVPFFNVSTYSQLLTLPDFPAYNIHHAFWRDKPDYAYFTRQLPRYYRKDGKLQGCGIKLFPDDKKNPTWLSLVGQ